MRLLKPQRPAEPQPGHAALNRAHALGLLLLALRQVQASLRKSAVHAGARHLALFMQGSLRQGSLLAHGLLLQRRLLAARDGVRLQGLAVTLHRDVAAVQTRQLPYPVAHDRDGSLARQWGDVRATPTAFVLDRKGRIARRFVCAVQALPERV